MGVNIAVLIKHDKLKHCNHFETTVKKMSRSILSMFLTVIISIIYLTCDHGLKPSGVESDGESGISGFISYNNWPAADSLKDLRLVVFKFYPPENILSEVISGNAIVYPGLNESNLPFYTDTTHFVLELDPGVYEYVVVAQKYGSNMNTDWQAVGQYDTVYTDPFPTVINVEPEKMLENINIHVDFNDLPEQPF